MHDLHTSNGGSDWHSVYVSTDQLNSLLLLN